MLRGVAVVIPCLNEAEPIAAVVREVLAQGVTEVIVVDNGSHDATPALVQRLMRDRSAWELAHGYDEVAEVESEALPIGLRHAAV